MASDDLNSLFEDERYEETLRDAMGHSGHAEAAAEGGSTPARLAALGALGAPTTTARSPGIGGAGGSDWLGMLELLVRAEPAPGAIPRAFPSNQLPGTPFLPDGSGLTLNCLGALLPSFLLFL